MTTIKKYRKITVGFVTQIFERQDNKFVCVEQFFTAGDQIDREDDHGNAVEINVEQEVYQPFDMEQPKAETPFEEWYEENKHNDGVQRQYRGVIEQNPDYSSCFKDWCNKYFQECVDI